MDAEELWRVVHEVTDEQEKLNAKLLDINQAQQAIQLPVTNDMLAQQYGLEASLESAAQIATLMGKVMELKYRTANDEPHDEAMRRGEAALQRDTRRMFRFNPPDSRKRPSPTTTPTPSPSAATVPTPKPPLPACQRRELPSHSFPKTSSAKPARCYGNEIGLNTTAYLTILTTKK